MAYRDDENGSYEPGRMKRSQRSSRPVRSRPVRSPEEGRRSRSAGSAVESPNQAARRRKQSSRFVDPRKKRTRRRRIISIVLAVVLLLLAGGAVAAYALIRTANDTIHPAQAQIDQIKAALATPKAPGQPFYMVIMGEDTRPNEKSMARSDTLMVVHVDPANKKVAIMSIPRDSRVAIPGHGTDKINAAAQIGGPALTIKTVTQFTGLPIAHYVVLDFNGFKSIVDAMGGVVLDVPVRINDLQAANHIPQAAVIEKGVQRLDGAHALTFVRARHQFPSQDIQRMADQQYFMKELVKQAKVQAANPLKTFAIVSAVARAVKTDMSVQDLAGLAVDFKGMADSDMQTVTMPGGDQTINGISYIIPNISGMKAIVAKMEAGESIDPKAAATALSTSATNAAVTPSTVQVAVRNGAGVSGLSKQAMDILLKAGYKVPETGNMSQFVYPQTLVVYKSDATKPQAVAVAQALGQGQLVVARGMYTFTADVLVVIGKDWDAKKAPGATAAAHP
jgi:LCP family protein required for cell wall assembly